MWYLFLDTIHWIRPFTMQTVPKTAGVQVVKNLATAWDHVMASLATVLLVACQARWGLLVRKVSLIVYKWLTLWNLQRIAIFICLSYALQCHLSDSTIVSIDCPSSHWGLNCANQCNCLGPCDPLTGRCITGVCVVGKVGTSCQEGELENLLS